MNLSLEVIYPMRDALFLVIDHCHQELQMERLATQFRFDCGFYGDYQKIKNRHRNPLAPNYWANDRILDRWASLLEAYRIDLGDERAARINAYFWYTVDRIASGEKEEDPCKGLNIFNPYEFKYKNIDIDKIKQKLHLL